MTKVPQNPFTYLRQLLKDTAFRASQFLNTIYDDIHQKTIKTYSLVETDTCERCNEQVKDLITYYETRDI
jgi:hypothetical protein